MKAQHQSSSILSLINGYTYQLYSIYQQAKAARMEKAKQRKIEKENFEREMHDRLGHYSC